MPNRWLAWSGVLLGLVVLVLLLASAAAPISGRAASVPGEQRGHPVRSQVFYAPAVSSTVFLPIVSRPESIEPNVWYGEYYDNVTLSGDPVYVTQEVRIDYDWGTGAPEDLPANSFSARWTGSWQFETGEYTFFAFADDGIRLWLDGKLLIDAWGAGGLPHQKTVQIGAEGLHKVKLEYMEQWGSAAIRLRWRRTDLYPMWQGDYYNQAWVEGTPLYSQSDSAIQFDWGVGCPEYLACDDFSIAWAASPLFEAGEYGIYYYADEGYQLFVDGNKVDEGGWYEGQGGGAEDGVYEGLVVSGIGTHQIVYNFHDRGGLAEARLWVTNLTRGEWKAEYFAGMNLAGAPVVTKWEGAVFHDWGYDKPYAKLPSGDGFSVRWSGQRYFHAGFYRFGMFADDGVRLWVDGELLVDQWHDGSTEYHAPVTYLNTGNHDVAVEYYENSGEAEIRLWWE